jgi:hypothetical protein
MVKDGAETDIDCGGGTCQKCIDGKTCLVPNDCVSGVCTGGICSPPTCTDGVKNGLETDVDCGGGCGPCGIGKACGGIGDCAFGGICDGGYCRMGLNCKDIKFNVPTAVDNVYTMDPDGVGNVDPFDAYCDMTTEGGGWTLVLKADGTQSNFSYSSAYWTNANLFNAWSAGLDSTEAKLQSWNSVPFDVVRVGLTDPRDGMTRYLEISRPGTLSISKLFSNTASPTTLGRPAWEGLLSVGSLQPTFCGEGFNIGSSASYASVRVGIIANQETNCTTPDSWIGIGGFYGTGQCNQSLANSVGNTSPPRSDCGPMMDANGQTVAAQTVRAMGYLFVR